MPSDDRPDLADVPGLDGTVLEFGRKPTIDFGVAPSRQPWLSRSVASFIRRKPLASFGGVVLGAFVLLAVLAPFVVTHDPTRIDAYAPLADPGSGHIFGTDRLGRDIYSRLVYGARVSLAVGVGAVLIALVLATTIGVVSGYYGGKTDLLLQRVVDVGISFPFLVALISFVRIVKPPSGVTSIGPVDLSRDMVATIYIVGVLGVLLSLNASRVIRGAVMATKSELYVFSASAVGASNARIMVRHILPNVAPTIIVMGTSYLGAAILIESALSFLGVGLPPSVPSWGRMLNEATGSIRQSLNVSLWPGLAIALVVYGANVLGDGLRDVLDPRLRSL